MPYNITLYFSLKSVGLLTPLHPQFRIKVLKIFFWGGTFPNFFCHLLVFCFSSELGKFPLKGYWKWEVLYSILFSFFIAALFFVILHVYLTYSDDGSVEVDVSELDVSELDVTEEEDGWMVTG